LIINKTDLALLVGADLGVMDRDARKMRGSGPFLFTVVTARYPRDGTSWRWRVRWPPRWRRAPASSWSGVPAAITACWADERLIHGGLRDAVLQPLLVARSISPMSGHFRNRCRMRRGLARRASPHVNAIARNKAPDRRASATLRVHVLDGSGISVDLGYCRCGIAAG
jgi:hypothetical protein